MPEAKSTTPRPKKLHNANGAAVLQRA